MIEPRIEVDPDAIRANVETLRASTGRPVMAVVKANGYGHGAVEAAAAAVAGGVAALGVVDVAEALVLRDAGITAPIVAWLHGTATDWIEAIEADIELGVSSIEQFEMLSTAAALADRPARVHIKVDTGLGRNGALECDWDALFSRMRELVSAGHGEFAGLFSHLAGTSRESDRAQVEAFSRAIAGAARRGVTPRVRHLAASAGALDAAEARFDLVRVGIALYGLTPYAPTVAPGVALRPAMRLVAPVVADADGGGAHVELGTADGLPPLDERAAARLRVVDERGTPWRLGAIGEVATPVEPATPAGGAAVDRPGTLSVLGGDASSADEWAVAAGTIGYEIVTRLVARLDRRAAAAGAASDRRADAAWPHDAAPPGPGSTAPGARRPRRRVRTARGDLAPRRVLTIDSARFRAGLEAQLERGTRELDVSADAYGLGLAAAVRLAREAGLEPVVRTRADAERARADTSLGLDPRVEPGAADGTRAAYAFGEAAGGVVRLVTELVHVKRVEPGQGVSYGAEWIASEPTTLGLVPIGYGDALTRRCGPSTRVRLLVEPGPGSDPGDASTVLAPIVGRVAMDQVVIELGDVEAWPGMPVVVFGPEAGDPSLAAVAASAGVSPASFVAALGSRIVRAWVGERP